MNNGGSKIIGATFSTDGSIVGVQLQHGFSMFQTSPFRLVARDDLNTVNSACIYKKSALCILSGAITDDSAPDTTVFIGNITEQGDWLHRLQIPEPVTELALTDASLLVRTAHSLYIFDIHAPSSPIHVSRPFLQCSPLAVQIPSRTHTALPQYIAYALSETVGRVLVFDPTPPRPHGVIVLEAHKSPVQTIALGWSGQVALMATASQTGTIVRVFALPEGVRVAVCRRGSASCAILSMAFSPTGSHLCAVSARGTLHIFEIPSVSARNADSKVGRTIGEWMQERRDVCGVTLPSLCVGKEGTSVRWADPHTVCVVSTGGQLVIYQFDPETSSLALMGIKNLA
ncbi:putative wd repeat domain phosphoinositide-interacting protein 2 protein [Carpediemonas membranifera]|uniref:Putative wd repeat domain phosphoinositide-interacting protein 2 protein n=1 Tax=Carpediemonas membranifera TaxID=201153 RepID=A0A8J6DYU4_9EUKA|nr:putative wd repeat domain phosphoinositide-interacting protein 2 protein [Carpediemonas membranifera]|eukprot:KAG9389576.1 putative wd repeat domain phosphoinositide-interacting protein 2 protein [Carpediemonas membranifera]